MPSRLDLLNTLAGAWPHLAATGIKAVCDDVRGLRAFGKFPEG